VRERDGGIPDLSIRSDGQVIDLMDRSKVTNGGIAALLTNATLHLYGRLRAHIAMEHVSKPPWSCKEARGGRPQVR